MRHESALDLSNLAHDPPVLAPPQPTRESLGRPRRDLTERRQGRTDLPAEI
jgi:hypothetical protein